MDNALTLEDAAFSIGVGSLSTIKQIALSIEQRIAYELHSRRAILSSLICRDLNAFVYDIPANIWYRIPSAYWVPLDYDIDTLIEKPILPETYYIRPSVSPPDQCDIIGNPIIVWQTDVADLAKSLNSLGEEILEASQPDGSKTRQANALLNGPIDSKQQFHRMSPTAQVTAWYLNRIEHAPPQGFTRLEDEQAGKSVGIGRDRIRHLRRDYAPPHWSADGPKRLGGTRRMPR